MRAPRLLCFLILLAVAPVCLVAQSETAAAYLEKMSSALSASGDCAAFLSVRAGEGGGEFAFHFFRRDRTAELLLIVQSPSAFFACAFFRRSDGIQTFNPQAAFWTRSDPDAVQERIGFYPEEIHPLLLASLLPRDGGVGYGSGPKKSDEFAVLELNPPADNRGVALLRLTLDRESGLPVRLEFFDPSGGRTRLVDYLSYFQSGKTFYPRQISIQARGKAPLLAEFDAVNPNPIPDFVFTRAYVEEITR